MIFFRNYRRQDRDWVMSAHVQHYRQVERFDRSFDDAVTAALDLIDQQIGDDRHCHIIAQENETRVGCVFFSAEDEMSGRIRLFFLTEAYRRRGLGKRMLTHLVDHARLHGFRAIRVSTFDRHREACGLYAAHGFAGKPSTPFEAFGQPVRQVDFELDL